MSNPSANDFAELALTLHGQPDVDGTATRVVQFAKNATGCDDASLLLVRSRRRLETAQATDERVRAVDDLQEQCSEGPSAEAVSGRDPVVAHDVATDTRWPVWGPQAAEFGVRSMIGIPLYTAERTIGVLNLYADAQAGFDEGDVRAANVVGRHATVALAAASEEEGLQHAARARHKVGLAQGILMEQLGIDAERAFDVLRRYSQDGNVKLREVADRVVAARQLPGDG